MCRSRAEDRIYEYIFCLLVVSIPVIGQAMIANQGIGAEKIHMGMWICILLGTFLFVGDILMASGGEREEKILRWILLLGCIMRIGYTFYNGVFSRVHDVWYYDDYTQNSKASYLMWLIEREKLPDTYEGQLYHQPFSYLFTAGVCKILQLMTYDRNIYFIGSIGGKLGSCMASCMTLLFSLKLCEELKMKAENKILAMWFVAFLPGMYLAAGRIGEDAFSCLFAVMEIYTALKWYHNSNIRNTIYTAIAFGFGLQTNLSCILPMGLLVILVLEKMVGDHDAVKKYIGQTAIFAGIAAPLGMWFYVRNAIRFGIPFTYINEQEVGNILWTGEHSLWERFAPINWRNLISSPYANAYEDYNLSTYFLKSEIFGEFSFEMGKVIPYTLLIINLLMTIFLIAFMFRLIIKREKEHDEWALMGMFAFYLLFICYSYYKEPFGCSMDARYFLIVPILKVVLLGKLSESLNLALAAGKGYAALMKAAMLLFGTASIVMFCSIS
ncbi:MAG: hypothetical protein ACLSHX_12765 [Suilimivivens sp.]